MVEARQRHKKGRALSGWVNFDKPLNMGSTQAVGKIRRLFDAQKAGHAGTLDPWPAACCRLPWARRPKPFPSCKMPAKAEVVVAGARPRPMMRKARL